MILTCMTIHTQKVMIEANMNNGPFTCLSSPNALEAFALAVAKLAWLFQGSSFNGGPL